MILFLSFSTFVLYVLYPSHSQTYLGLTKAGGRFYHIWIYTHKPAVKPEQFACLQLFSFLESLPWSAAGPVPQLCLDPLPHHVRSLMLSWLQPTCKWASLTKHIPAKCWFHTYTVLIKHPGVARYHVLVCMCLGTSTLHTSWNYLPEVP